MLRRRRNAPASAGALPVRSCVAARRASRSSRSALVLYFSVRTDAFFGRENARVIAEFSAPLMIIAAGQVMLLICGEIDLSVGHVFAFSRLDLLLRDHELGPAARRSRSSSACSRVPSSASSTG